MKKFGLVSSAVLMMAGATAASADEISVVCSAEQDWCDLMVAAFEAENADGAQIHGRDIGTDPRRGGQSKD
jgi:iron(III) transport system substrate-binding protein